MEHAVDPYSDEELKAEVIGLSRKICEGNGDELDERRLDHVIKILTERGYAVTHTRDSYDFTPTWEFEKGDRIR